MIPPLIPMPAELQQGSEADAFIFDAATSIHLSDSATGDALFAARQLQTALCEATGLLVNIRKVADPAAGARRVALLQSKDEDLGPEGYALRVTRDGIAATASTDAGLFYAVQTLKQLLKTCGARIPALTIRDRPALAHRGLMVDVSRGKVPTLQTLFSLVDGLSSCKYNQLQLYVEHTFDFPSHPDIAAGTDPLTSDDILAVDEYCRQRHVELVPNLQSFGHQRHLLSLPQYAHLDEVGWRWSLSPALDDTYRLLGDLYADFLPAFTSRWLNVDCDETWDLGTGQSRSLAEQHGKGRLYLHHILRLRELAAQHGCRIMLWADVLHHYPELVPELPEDVLLLDWEYEAADAYPTTEALGKSGRQFWVCPGTSSWNTLFPRLDNALGNIRNYVRDGLQAGATGMLLTDWGDHGHYQPLALSLYPALFGAATAWTGARTSPEEFNAACAPLFLAQPPESPSLQAMHRLGTAINAPTLGLRNRSAIALALFEDPLTGSVSASADPRALQEAQSAAIAAGTAWAALVDRTLRQDYGFTARLIEFAASRTLLAQDIRRTLASLPAPPSPDGLAQLDEALARLVVDRSLVPALRAEFEQCWLRHARRSEIHLTLEHFDVLQRDYDDAVAWLRGQRARFDAGQPIDADLASYSPRPFARLWQQGMADLRNLESIAGQDALPENVRGWLHPAPVG